MINLHANQSQIISKNTSKTDLERTPNGGHGGGLPLLPVPVAGWGPGNTLGRGSLGKASNCGLEVPSLCRPRNAIDDFAAT